MNIFTDTGNQQTLKVIISSKLVGCNINIQFVNDNASTVPYLRRNVLPVLKIDDELYIHSANAICRYILATAGKDSDDIEVDEWLEWEATILQSVLGPFLNTSYSGGKGDFESLKSSLSHLEKNLKDKSSLVGDAISAADICLFGALYPLYAKSNNVFTTYPNISLWFSSLSSQESFQAAVTDVTEGTGAAAFKRSILAQPLINATPSNQSGGGGNKEKKGKEKASSEVAAEEPPAEVFSAEVVAAAKEVFLKGKSQVPKPLERKHPVLPEDGKRNILITSALPYVNNVPHLGTIIGCVLSGDVFSRFCRLRNYNVLYICGTDEYGTATETKALEEGLTPQQICDKYFKLHDEVYKWFNIDFDHFGRTTTQQQTVIAQDIFWKLYKNGHVIQDSVEQLKCENCDRYLADRFVEGICPLCNYDDARGDQCDKCGKLINATDLKKPRCKICSNTPVVKKSNHLFIDLPKLEPKLKAFLDKSTSEGDWTSNAKLITSSWIRDGLKPRCITRDLKWGTPVPLEGYTDKVFYVWFDAPIGYPSITANYTDKWELWWKNPQKVSTYNFMAKDNVPFHSVVFPCSLLGADDNWSLVNHLVATEYLNYEDTKFSKSRGIGVFGDHAAQTGIPADIWRFYLLFIRPETQDSAFSWSDFVWKNNSELLNNLGNFINRGLMFLDKNFGGIMPALDLLPDDCQLIAAVQKELDQYLALLEKVKIRDALKHILNISRMGNQHIQANQPWVKVKGTPEEKARAGTVIGLTVNISCLLSVMLQPYMPDTSKIIQDQLQAPPDVNILNDKFVCFLEPGHKIGTPKPLFAKIEPQQAEDLKKRFAGKQEKSAPEAKKEESKPAPAPAATTAPNPADVERLTKEVAQQGDVVRKLKTAGADKAQVDAEVKKLLELKRNLAIASGEDPDAGKKSKGKKGKKK